MLTLVTLLPDGKRALYLCECGAEKVLWKNNVNTGHTKSCGCLRKKATSARSTTHGHKSCGDRSKTYVVWMNMKSRCTNQSNKSYKNYGGRGISFDPRWGNFEAFLADMGEVPDGLSLDRVDVNGPYSKDNCRWATKHEQVTNKRNNVRYLFDGRSQTLPEWSRDLGIKRLTLYYRIKSGMSVEQAFTTPTSL